MLEQKQALLSERLRREEAEARKAQGIEDSDDPADEDMKGMDERLRKARIGKESKIIIHEKMTSLDTNLNKTMEDRLK